nr:hypothetical protein GOBAR_AA07869 [Ipomoea trifida]
MEASTSLFFFCYVCAVLAEMEASGTSNMKFAVNGCILIRTLDEANVEKGKRLERKTSLFLGLKAHEIAVDMEFIVLLSLVQDKFDFNIK